MTKMEDLTTILVDNSTAELLLLQGWGKPQGTGLGPRDRTPVKLHFDETKAPSKTHQSFKDECNINNIMSKYRKTGELQHLNKHNPTYGDFDSGLDFHTSQNAVLKAQADFDSLSAEIRARMDNDPGNLLTYMNDPDNLEEARELGLIAPEPVPEMGTTPQGATASEPSAPPPQPAETTPIEGGE